MAEPVWVHLYPDPLARRLDAQAHKVLSQRPVAVDENVLSLCRAADLQIRQQGADYAFGKINGPVLHALAVAHDEPSHTDVQVFEKQVLHLADPQLTLPEQVEGRPVEEGVAQRVAQVTQESGRMILCYPGKTSFINCRSRLNS